MTLPAFAAERRAAAPLLLLERRRLLHGAPAAGAPCSNRPISPTRTALSSKPAAAPVDRWDRQTDGRTDALPFHRPCCAYYVGSVDEPPCL